MMKRLLCLLLGLACASVAFVLALAGCGGSGVSGTGASAAVESWRAAIESGNTAALANTLAPNYAYDGVERTGDSADALPAPGFMGKQGELTVEVVDVVESGDKATARVKVTYTGVLEDIGYGEPGADGPVYTDPGIAPPSPPADADLPDEAGNGGGEGGGSDGGYGPPPRTFAVREVAGEQVSVTPLTFTAMFVLGLDRIGGVWAVTSQRQEWSLLLVGSGIQAPIIEQLLANGSPSAQVDPRSDISITGTVRQTTADYVYCRVGYIGADLPVVGSGFSGVVRAPRRPGLYVLEARAINEAPNGGAYAIATRSIEVEVLSSGDTGFSFAVDDGVGVSAEAEAALRAIAEGLYAGNLEALQSYIANDYSYDGGNAYSALWRLPFAYYYESDLAVRVVSAVQVGATEIVDVHFRQIAEDFWGYGGPVYDDIGGDAGPPSAEGRPANLPPHVRNRNRNENRNAAGANSLPPHLRAAGIRQSGMFPSTNYQMVIEGDIRIEFEPRDGALRVTAIRPILVTTKFGDAPELTMDSLTANGGDAPEVEGASVVHLAGAISGRVDWLQLYSYDTFLSLAPTTGAFEGEVVAPFTRGRWLAGASAGAWNESGNTYVQRTVELNVTSNAPTPEFTVGSGVTISPGALATLNRWLAGVFLYSYDGLSGVYSPDYSYDGDTADSMQWSPRLYAYHASFDLAEITAAVGDGGLTVVTCDLRFRGPWQWFERIPWGAGEPPDVGGRQCSDMAPYEAETDVSMTFKLDAGGLIVAERIDRGTSVAGGGTPIALGPVTIDGAAPGVVAAGASVMVAASVTAGGPSDGSARIGPSYQYAPEGAAEVAAPTTPGTYLAEVVVRTYGYIGDDDIGTRPLQEDCIAPGYMVSAISAAEVDVR